MKRIKLYEWWLKTHDKQDKERKVPAGTHQENWARILRSTDNPMERAFPEVSLNKTGFRKTKRGETEVVTRSLYFFRNPNDRGTLLGKIKNFDEKISKELGELIDWGLFNLNYRMAIPRDYSVIMFPKSSSKILDVMWEHLLLDVQPEEDSGWKGKQIPWNPTIITNAFEKRKCKDVEWDLQKIDKVDNPRVRDQVYAQIEKFNTTLADKVPSLKTDVYLMHRQFIKKFMDIRPSAVPTVKATVPGKGVIILDDFVTHGTTKEEMINLVLEYKPRKILFLSLFDIINP